MSEWQGASTSGMLQSFEILVIRDINRGDILMVTNTTDVIAIWVLDWLLQCIDTIASGNVYNLNTHRLLRASIGYFSKISFHSFTCVILFTSMFFADLSKSKLIWSLHQRSKVFQTFSSSSPSHDGSKFQMGLARSWTCIHWCGIFDSRPKREETC